MGKILIRDLKIPAIIGTITEERLKEQELIVNIELRCDLSIAGNTDDLADTVDYLAVYRKVTEMIRWSKFRLLEKLAEEIVKICFEQKKVVSVKVFVEKPEALPFCRSSAIEIERFKKT